MKFSDLGVYNSKGAYKTRENGKQTKAYRAWNNMLQRCYEPKYHEKYPNYVECSVDERWLDFQDFAKWFYSQEYNDTDYHLDKDLLFPNNKIYGPETCVLIPPQINTLLNNRSNDRGDLPIGVSIFRNKFQAQINIDGRNNHLGHFNNVNDASKAFKQAKEQNVKSMAKRWKGRIDNRIYNILINWSM